MNYLVTHYKNLAEQLQARINHIQQCLYEMESMQSHERPDGTWVDDYNNPIPGSPGYVPPATLPTTRTPPPVVYPQAPKGPYRTLEDINPSRWGISVDANGRPIQPVPLTAAWIRARDAYLAAVKTYKGYQRSETGTGIYTPRDTPNR